MLKRDGKLPNRTSVRGCTYTRPDGERAFRFPKRVGSPPPYPRPCIQTHTLSVKRYGSTGLPRHPTIRQRMRLARSVVRCAIRCARQPLHSGVRAAATSRYAYRFIREAITTTTLGEQTRDSGRQSHLAQRSGGLFYQGSCHQGLSTYPGGYFPRLRPCD
jgi:hypothetical protein